MHNIKEEQRFSGVSTRVLELSDGKGKIVTWLDSRTLLESTERRRFLSHKESSTHRENL